MKKTTMKLKDIAQAYADLFRGYGENDVSNNGLQVEASETITRVAFAVDACLETIEGAVDAGAQLLVVHHGISWNGGLKRLDGFMARRLQELFVHGVSLYASHIPLDMHPVVGNNAGLASIIGLKKSTPFYHWHDMEIGRCGALPKAISLKALATRLCNALESDAQVYPFGRSTVRNIGVVSGGAGDAIYEAYERGLDTVVTGEFRHELYHGAQELGINVIDAGHYATETVGPKAWMNWTSKTLQLDCVFVEAPTGL